MQWMKNQEEDGGRKKKADIWYPRRAHLSLYSPALFMAQKQNHTNGPGGAAPQPVHLTAGGEKIKACQSLKNPK